MAVRMPTATPAPGPNAKPETMAGIFEASNLSQVTPGSKGEFNERKKNANGAHEGHGDQLLGGPCIGVLGGGVRGRQSKPPVSSIRTVTVGFGFAPNQSA